MNKIKAYDYHNRIWVQNGRNRKPIKRQYNFKISKLMKAKQQIVLRQIELQEKIQSAGFNIVECGNCGTVLLHECGDEKIDCFCGETMALSDCPDLYYSGMENNAEFEDLAENN
jgi:hypothetical protein